jgi:hypothetical protein
MMLTSNRHSKGQSKRIWNELCKSSYLLGVSGMTANNLHR